MTKKSDIIEHLKNGTDIDDIVEELKVTKSYVYRIQREFQEDENDIEESTETEDNNMDSDNEHSSDRNSDEVEGDKEGVDKKDTKRKTDTNNGMGGVKKRSKVHKKRTNVQKESTKTENVKKWMNLTWKKILSMLILLSLLITAIFLSKTQKKKQPSEVIQSRFPILTP